MRAHEPSFPKPPWLDTAAWPFAPKFFPVEGAHLHYVEEGTGPDLVLVHGTPTWGFEWRHVIKALVGTHRVFCPDHLGFGLSQRPTDAVYTPEAHAKRFAQWIAACCGDRKVTLVVHDFGGPIALDWALDHPERLQRLVIVNTWMWSFAEDPLMSKRAKMIDGILGRFLYRHMNASLKLIMPSAYGVKSRLTQEIHRQYLSVFPDPESRERVLYALAKSLLGSSAYFQSLWERRERLHNVPVSILWGLKDSAFQPPTLERFKVAIPHAKVTTFPDAGHWPHEEVPEAFIAALKGR